MYIKNNIIPFDIRKTTNESWKHCVEHAVTKRKQPAFIGHIPRRILKLQFRTNTAVTNYNIVHFLCDVNMTSNITYIIRPERSDDTDLCVCVCMQLVTFAELNNSYWIICPPWVICVIVITSMQSILRGCTQLSQVMWKLFNK